MFESTGKSFSSQKLSKNLRRKKNSFLSHRISFIFHFVIFLPFHRLFPFFFSKFSFTMGRGPKYKLLPEGLLADVDDEGGPEGHRPRVQVRPG